jgi:hypothetical protein
VKLVRNGVIMGTDQPGTGDVFPFTAGTSQHGDQGGEDGLWGLSWGESDINDADFGVAVSVSATGGIYPAFAEIDWITIQVNYTLPAAAGQEYVAVQTLPFDAWSEELARGGESFVGHQPTDGAIVVDTSAAEQGYTPTELPGDWGEEGRGDWYATLPQGVEVVVSSAVDSVPSFFAPLPDWPEVAGDAFAIVVDLDFTAADACNCFGSLAEISDGCGTLANPTTTTDDAGETIETDGSGTMRAVSDGCGTLKTIECAC